LFLKRPFVSYSDFAAVVTAGFGAWLMWSQLSNVSKLSWFYDYVEYVQARRESPLPNPDYDLGSLPWQTAHPEAFDFHPGAPMHLTTSPEPFGYQAFAAVDTRGARLADIQFEADVESGGVTIGLLESGKWIASSASQRRGRFADANSVLLGYHRSITVVIANNNPEGKSRLTVKWLRLYLRK